MLHEAAQRSEEWFEARSGKLTASIAAACLGLDPYISRQKAWRTILGMEPRQENGFQRYGNEHEADAISEYEVAAGVLVAATGFHVHPTIPWLGASPDGLVGDQGLLEVKCPHSGIIPGRVPIHHRIQVLVQLECTGRQWCDYVVWTPASIRCWRIQPAGTAGLLRRLERFWVDHVVPMVEPPRKRRRVA